MSELQKYTGRELIGMDCYKAHEADARLALMQQQIDSLQAGSAKLMADNAEYAKRHLLLQRAVDFCQRQLKFLPCEVPAEFAEIIRSKT